MGEIIINYVCAQIKENEEKNYTFLNNILAMVKIRFCANIQSTTDNVMFIIDMIFKYLFLES